MAIVVGNSGEVVGAKLVVVIVVICTLRGNKFGEVSGVVFVVVVGRDELLGGVVDGESRSSNVFKPSSR